jgi:hypothetical protein
MDNMVIGVIVLAGICPVANVHIHSKNLRPFLSA